MNKELLKVLKGVKKEEVEQIKKDLSVDVRAAFKKHLKPTHRVKMRYLTEEFIHLHGVDFLSEPDFKKFVETSKIEMTIEESVSYFSEGVNVSDNECAHCGSATSFSKQYRKFKKFCSEECFHSSKATDIYRNELSEKMTVIMNDPEVRRRVKTGIATQTTPEERTQRARVAASKLWDVIKPEKLQEIKDKRREVALETLESRFRLVHGDIYEYPNITTLTKVDGLINIICKEHGEFTQLVFNHMAGQICPKCCNRRVSKGETEVFDLVGKLFPTAQQSNRSILENGKEIDVWVPDVKVAVEYDGVYWHSSGSRDTDDLVSKSHHSKTVDCESKGIRLYHIFETEWQEKRIIWQSVLCNALGKSPDKIYARQCKVVEVAPDVAKAFQEDNHLQGSCGASVRLGLEFEGQLVSLMTFGKPRYNKDHEWELIRFCNLIFTNVVGAASRLLKNFTRSYGGDIISYANRRWSDGGLYQKLGFEYIGDSEPSYYYVDTKRSKILHRSTFMKHKLVNILENFDPNLSEVDNMYNHGFRRIWDCGSKVYSMKKPLE